MAEAANAAPSTAKLTSSARLDGSPEAPAVPPMASTAAAPAKRRSTVGRTLLVVQSKNGSLSGLGGGPLTNANEQPAPPQVTAAAKTSFRTQLGTGGSIVGLLDQQCPANGMPDPIAGALEGPRRPDRSSS